MNIFLPFLMSIQRVMIFWGLIAGCCLGSFQMVSGGAKGEFVLEVDLFVAVDCPIANAYSPEINRLHAEFAPLGVRLRLVYPDAALEAAEVAEHRKEYGLAPEGVLDPEHSLVKRAGASVTPEAAVFDARGRLRYRGRIDNRFTDYGEKRRVVTERDLEETLRRLLAGEELEFHKVEAIGCLIEPLSGH